MTDTQLTDDHRSFLRRIKETPEDDTPRLVFADWLDEWGDPAWAEFIRVQCALKQVNPAWRFWTEKQRDAPRDPKWEPPAGAQEEWYRRERDLFPYVQNRWSVGGLAYLHPPNMEDRQGDWTSLDWFVIDRGLPGYWYGTMSRWAALGRVILKQAMFVPAWDGVRLLDREPSDSIFSGTAYPAHRRGDRCWRWWCSANNVPNLSLVNRYTIPPLLFKCLTNVVGLYRGRYQNSAQQDGAECWEFPTLEAANRALGHAALDWAKEGASDGNVHRHRSGVLEENPGSPG